ncbi:hypothetical protein HYZ98_00960 [Candidatus Peregrinibacteria bacterium]|nr:hypothetical protein [Candidatus Peregrinibacteria bacterium]
MEGLAHGISDLDEGRELKVLLAVQKVRQSGLVQILVPTKLLNRRILF